MTIALAEIPVSNLWTQAVTLAVVAVVITAAVYGSVALIVKMDDIGLHLAKVGRTGAGRAFGRGLVLAMPKVLAFLSTLGTAAMLWVGGAIIIHGMEVLGFTAPGHLIEAWAVAAAHAVPQIEGAVEWLVKAALGGVSGLVLGLLLIPLATRVVGPVWEAVVGKKPAIEDHG